MAEGLSYRDAGVDRDVAERAKNRIGELVASTQTDGVLSRVGAFGGLFRVPAGYRSPVLVSSADGVGTKLKVAMRAGRHDTVGHDLVNHCVDDILVEGACPLFFLDYIGMGALDERVVAQLVTGLAAGCRENGCALLGGETAEMPDFYDPGEYDLAGFIVGMVEEEGRPSVDRVRAGDVLIGLASSGFHTNGYSLLRRLLFDRLGLDLGDAFPGAGAPVGEVLLRIHRSYLASLGPLMADDRLHALAHITGGGIPGNLERSIPVGLQGRVERSSWEVPAEFSGVREAGGIAEDEMFRTFNMGVGMILAADPAGADGMVESLTGAGENAWIIGEVGHRRDDEDAVALV
ncbi:MAG TPA: phosphoribosylformylglycinamidine cyclo-ligase [Longimicrobiales bacterium]|nr:phosphoribosylformylglycinamidine cyclo-ligase [Longimicrobiales bacterium]